MAKIKVILNAALHDGKGVKQPGETVSMEQSRAERMARLGMVKLPKEAKKNGGAQPGKIQTPPVNTGGDDDGDAGGEGEDSGDNDNQNDE
jgi:hypothetical protein